MDSIAEKIRDILAIELQVSKDALVSEARLRADLGMDSVAALNILYAVEETLGGPVIDVTELADVKTVGDVEALLRARLELPPKDPH